MLRSEHSSEESAEMTTPAPPPQEPASPLAASAVDTTGPSKRSIFGWALAMLVFLALAWFVGGVIVPVWQVTLNSVGVGGIKLNNVAATVIEGDKPSEVLLGNSFLRHTDIQQTSSVLIIRERY